MSLTFPASPTVGDTYTVGARTWTWSGTMWEITGTVAAAGSIGTTELADSAITTAKIAAGAVTYAKLAADAKPKTYVTKYTTNGAGTWTCPAGVTQIKLTLIGAGGACGDVEAITAFSSTSTSFSGNTAGSTTFVIGGTTYTALGGKKGANVSVTGDIFEMSVSIGSASGSSGVDDADYNRYPGCGGAPSTASAYTQRTWLDGDVYALHRSRAYAHGKRGQDGVTQVFQITVVPSTVYSFTVGAAAGYDGITTYSTQGSNGAVIIEYVV